jgi:hypothetical protein
MRRPERDELLAQLQVERQKREEAEELLRRCECRCDALRERLDTIRCPNCGEWYRDLR